MKSLFFSSTELCISQAMLLTSTRGCWTGWLKNTHYKAPASELLRALPISPPPDGGCCLYDEPELTDHYMQVLMKPLKPGQAPRTKFLVKELLYVPRTIYAFWRRPWIPSMAMTHPMKKLSEWWRICFSTSCMASPSIIMTSRQPVHLHGLDIIYYDNTIIK